MVFKNKTSQILCIFGLFLLISSPTDARKLKRGLEEFSKRLFSNVDSTNSGKNTIIAPFSVATCTATARMGAEGQTAGEIDRTLTSCPRNPVKLAQKFQNLLQPYQSSSILKVANKVYIMEGLEIQEEFMELLTKYFFSSAEEVDFADRAAAARIINYWVESKTNGLIKYLISPDSLDANTRLVLVNAIHFKGEWENKFDDIFTQKRDFYLNETHKTEVLTMLTEATFAIGDISELDATALEMPYKDSDLAMLIILPNSRAGLPDLQEKLKNFPLANIKKNMNSESVFVSIPKFKDEFSIELSEPLKNLGASRMFSDAAQFGKMLKSPGLLKVSQFVHKAVIEVNEEGAEAAGASGIETSDRMGGQEKVREFIADKPFVYYIINSKNVIIFNGNVKNFN